MIILHKYIYYYFYKIVVVLEGVEMLKKRKKWTSMGKIEIYFSKIGMLRKYGKVKRKN